jgi:hypothetical protein
MSRAGLGSLALLGMLAVAPTAAHGWKPSMHLGLAQIAWQDATDDGFVVIERLNPSTGKGVGRSLYAVDPSLLAALRLAPDTFFAGVVGPDAYPDALTGQTVIHPAVSGCLSRDSGLGSDAWLTELWRASHEVNSPPAEAQVRVQAFVAGFLTHAAGDMYGHTFVNYFAGGAFALGPNAVRHILVEDYVARRMPVTPWPQRIGIQGIEDFMYRNMVDGLHNDYLWDCLLVQGTAQFSVPGLFSGLARKLDEDVRQHDSWWLPRQYWLRWIDDIEDGLRAWPSLSQELGNALIFPESGEPDIATAQRSGQRYVTDHLLSMLGAPDFVGDTLGLALEVQNRLNDYFNLTLGGAVERIDEMKRDLTNWAMKHALGLTLDEFKEYAINPERYFDALMGPGSPGGGVKTTLAALNHGELGISDRGYAVPSERFDWHAFAPAYNTVTMTKLILLRRDELARLIRDLGGGSYQLGPPNAMLGFNRTLDGSMQWSANARKLSLVEAGVYHSVFRRQTGEPWGQVFKLQQPRGTISR